jgi:hypothetical protein
MVNNTPTKKPNGAVTKTVNMELGLSLFKNSNGKNNGANEYTGGMSKTPFAKQMFGANAMMNTMHTPIAI